MSLPLFHHLSISYSISYPILNHEQNTILPELSIDYFSILFFLFHFIFLPLCHILLQVPIIQYHSLINTIDIILQTSTPCVSHQYIYGNQFVNYCHYYQQGSLSK